VKISFSKLSFPKGLNLELLKPFLTEQKLSKLISLSAKKGRGERRIVLPSSVCLRKVVAHYFWTQILAGKVTWPRLKKELRKTGSLRILKFTKSEIRRLWLQREKEIEREKQ
jgi:hypothetical protein